MMNPGMLTNKRALVTGASRGIGSAIALRLARDGAHVFVHYSGSRDAAEAIVSEIEQFDGVGKLIHADLATLDGVKSVVRQVAAEDGLIDILVNNAGVQVRDGISAIDEADFDRLYAVNVKAPFFLVQGLLNHLADRGRIINLSSGLAQIAFPDKMAYAMGKAAIVSFTKSLADALGPRGITVNAVAPGIIETDMNPWVKSPQAAARVAGLSALGRVGLPQDVADIVAFLASNDARWITGTTIDASGGA